MSIGWKGGIYRVERGEKGEIIMVNIGFHRHVWEGNEGNRSWKGWKSGRRKFVELIG